jgi:hypothetical protein
MVTEHLEESRQEQSEHATAGPAGWYALWTRSHCEQLVFDLFQRGNCLLAR